MDQLLEEISAKNIKAKEIIDIERNIDLDVGTLTIWDPNNFAVPRVGASREDYFRNIARQNTQIALNKFHELSEDGLLKLPESKNIIPRAKPLPKPKAPTKWETFAAKKGIKKKNRRE